MNKTKWLGHEIDEVGIKPNKEKAKAKLELKHPKNQKQLNHFSVPSNISQNSYQDYRKEQKDSENSSRKTSRGIGENSKMKILKT